LKKGGGETKTGSRVPEKEKGRGRKEG